MGMEYTDISAPRSVNIYNEQVLKRPDRTKELYSVFEHMLVVCANRRRSNRSKVIMLGDEEELTLICRSDRILMYYYNPDFIWEKVVTE